MAVQVSRMLASCGYDLKKRFRIRHVEVTVQKSASAVVARTMYSEGARELREKLLCEGFDVEAEIM